MPASIPRGSCPCAPKPAHSKQISKTSQLTGAFLRVDLRVLVFFDHAVSVELRAIAHFCNVRTRFGLLNGWSGQKNRGQPKAASAPTMRNVEACLGQFTSSPLP